MSEQWTPTPLENEVGQGAGNEDPNDIASGFLKNIPQEHQQIVGQYLPQWQAGVTRRFQSLADEHRPWKDLGRDYDEVTSAIGIWDLLESDPKRVLDMLTEIGSQNGWLNNPSGVTPPPPVGQPNLPGASVPSGLPPEWESKLSQIEKVVMALGQETINQREERTQAEQDRQLAGYMEFLHKTHGNFDDDFILSRLAAGIDGDTAVKQYTAMVDQILQSHNGTGGRPTPRVLSGAGSVQVDRGPDYAKMSNQDVRNEIQARLAASAQQS